jgi:hypothetical protein
MKYSIGDTVCVIKTNEIKKIIDFEIICDVEIYYMLDNTSYSENQLQQITSEETFKIKLEINKEIVHEFIDYEQLVNNVAEWYKKRTTKFD